MMKANVFISILLAAMAAVHAEKTVPPYSSCSSQRVLRYYPETLFNDRDLGSSQVTIDTRSGLADIAGQMSIQENQDIAGKTEIEQLRVCVLNVKAAMESVGLTSLDLLGSSVLKMTMYINKAISSAVREEIKYIAMAFGSPSVTVVGIEQLSFEDIKVAVKATVTVPDHFIEAIKRAKCKGNELFAHNQK